MRRLLALASIVLACACGGDDGTTPPACTPPAAFPVGDATGHAQPLGAGPTEARAGRVTAADLPAVPSGLITWKAGDYVLANDRVALVIEDVGDSDLYDPWGGRPVGLARVAGGRMVEPANFGELFLLTGRASLITEDVSVLNDGANGQPAVIRTVGTLHPLPFFSSITMGVFEDLTGVRAAIDYELAPGSNKVDIRYRYLSDVDRQLETGGILHALMYAERTPTFVPGAGWSDQIGGAPYFGVVDDGATSWAYVPAGQIGSALAVSGFVGGVAQGFRLPACAAFDRVHASLIIGGPGLDGLVAAVAGERAEAVRAITGTVTRGGAPAPGVHVHAVDAATDTYYSRTTTAADGSFTVHVPTTAGARLVAVAEAAQVTATVVDAATSTATIAMPAPARLHLRVFDNVGPLPARIQLLPAPGQELPNLPGNYGEKRYAGDRLRVVFSVDGDETLAVPAGTWELVSSHGFEYAVDRRTITLTPGQNLDLVVDLPVEVDSSGLQCGDFHIHTSRSNDSGDDGLLKVESAIADGLELPVRSDHEYVADFSAEIAALGAQRWAARLRLDRAVELRDLGPHGRVPADARSDQGQRRRPEVADLPDRRPPRRAVRDAVAGDGVRRGAGAARGAGDHHQPPARVDQLLRLRRLRRRHRHGHRRRRLGHQVHAGRGVQRRELAEHQERHRARLVRAAARRPQGVRGRLVGQPRHHLVAGRLPAHLPVPGHRRSAPAHRQPGARHAGRRPRQRVGRHLRHRHGSAAPSPATPSPAWACRPTSTSWSRPRRGSTSTRSTWWSTARSSTPSRSCPATPTRPTRRCGGAARSRSTCAPTAPASW
jgi:hypothetical protein